MSATEHQPHNQPQAGYPDGAEQKPEKQIHRAYGFHSALDTTISGEMP